jgi:hypothetical protein
MSGLVDVPTTCPDAPARRYPSVGETKGIAEEAAVSPIRELVIGKQV